MNGSERTLSFEPTLLCRHSITRHIAGRLVHTQVVYLFSVPLTTSLQSRHAS